MKRNKSLCRLNWASWIPCLRISISVNGWYLGFDLRFSVVVVMGAPLSPPLVYSMNMLIGLVLINSFGKWEGLFVEVSLGTPDRLMIGTVEGYLIGLSLVISLGSPLESPNPGSDLPGILLGAHLGLWFGSEAARFLCFCCRLMNFHEATC